MRACAICGSRRWRKSASGLVACEEGHILQNYRHEESTMDAPSQFALTRRTLRVNRAGRKVRKSRGHFTGPEEAYLRLEVLQVLLRSQIEAVRHLWKLGEEIEVLARDLWVVVLSLYPLPPPPEETQPPLEETQPPPPPLQTSTSLPNLASHATKISRSNTAPNLYRDAEKETSSEDEKETSLKPSSSESSVSSSSRESSTSSQEMIDRLSNDSRSPSETAPTSPLRRPRRGRHRRSTAQRHGLNPGPNARITPSVVLRITILSLWMARVPVTLSDVVRAVTEGRIPYINWGRRGFDDMRERMGRGLRGMGPKRPPSISHLYHSLAMLVDRLEHHCGIRFPNVNVPLLLWRLTREIGGTPTIYTHTYRLLQRLHVSMTVSRPSKYTKWHHYSAEKNRRTAAAAAESSAGEDDEAPGPGPPKRRLAELCPVELRVATALIVTLKLAYGLDADRLRIPADMDDPAAHFPRPEGWLRELRGKLKEGWFRRHVLSREPIDFAYLSPEDADEFLAQAARTLNVSSRIPQRQQVINLFPLEDVEVPVTTTEPIDEIFEAWCGYHSRARLNLPSTTTPAPQDGPDKPRSKIQEPGQGYRVYDWRRPEDVPRDLSLLITVVAEIVGLDQCEVLKELYAFELLLLAANRKIRGKTQVKRRKKRRSGDGKAATADGAAGSSDGDADGESDA